MPGKRLTDTTISRAKLPPDKREIWLWDENSDYIRGQLGLRLSASKKSWYYAFRVRFVGGGTGPYRRILIGQFPQISTELAREKAKRLSDQVIEGIDPVDEDCRRREEAVRADEERARKSRLVEDMAKRFMEEHAPKRSEKTQAEYQKIWGRVLPRIGNRPVAEVAWTEVDELHRSIGQQAPILANRALSVLSKAFSLAQRWGWYPRDVPNPARDHDRYAEPKDKGRALSPDQLHRFGQALDEEGDSVPALALRFITLCGCRTVEVLKLQWRDLDESGRVIHLPTSKTGPRSVYLGLPAEQIILSMKELGLSDEWVFPSPWKHHRGPMYDLKSVWGRVRDRADLAEFRLYDATRHTFTTKALELGIPVDRVKILVGHSNGDVTGRYTHYSREFLLSEADRVASWLDEVMRHGAPRHPKVLEFGHRRDRSE